MHSSKPKYVCFLILCIIAILTYLNLSEDKIALKHYKAETHTSKLKIQMPDIPKTSYLENSPCVIPKLLPLSDEVLPYIGEEQITDSCLDSTPCSGTIMTYVVKEDNNFILKIIDNLVNELICCYIEVIRPNGTDDEIYFGKSCYFFTREITIKDSATTIKVICSNGYENVHYIFRGSKKPKNFDPNKPNVLVIGIDSMSRMNLIRTMPKTFKFLIKEDWLEFDRYNKVGDNTLPNLQPALAGQPDMSKTCNKNVSRDNCNLIWKDFKKLGYTTAYAEDWPFASTFNYQSDGFEDVPTDYYLRPYFLAQEYMLEKEHLDVVYCYGPENIGIRMTEFIKDYATAVHRLENHFGMFWMNSFSHSDVNCPMTMDDTIAAMFRYLLELGVFENTIVVFMSDHGGRWGRIAKTQQGWYENMLPFLYIWLPDMVKYRYPNKYTNILKNTQRLISPYDLYLTLQEILEMYHPNFEITRIVSCLNCTSLFGQINIDRTCADAGIPHSYCVCVRYTDIADITGPTARKWGEVCVHYINRLLKRSPCSPYKLGSIYSLRVVVDNENQTFSKISDVVVVLKTDPSAEFEVSITIVNNLELTIQHITRLDKYRPHVGCLTGDDVKLEKYCYCKDNKIKEQNIARREY